MFISALLKGYFSFTKGLTQFSQSYPSSKLEGDGEGGGDYFSFAAKEEGENYFRFSARTMAGNKGRDSLA